MKLALKILGGVAAVVVAVVLAGVYVFGPSFGGVLLGKPIFLFNASDKRVNQAMLDTAELAAIYGDSEEFAQAKERAEEDLSNRDLVADAIKAAGGKHSEVYTTSEEKEREESPAPNVELKDGVVWATVPGTGRFDDGQAYADTLAHGITELGSSNEGGACAAVVDLRGNGGGDMGPMIAGLSPLLPDGPVLSFVGRLATTDVVVDGNSVQGGGTPTTSTGGKVDVPVAVVVDKDTASSGEATMLSFRGLENSRSFGEPTAGFASANVVLDYPNGQSLMLTTAKDRDRSGREYAEDPIEPDAPLSELDGWLAQRCGR